MVLHGLFTNMGHAQEVRVEQCKAQCVHSGVAPRTLISIRDPYSFWRSVYTYNRGVVRTEKNFEGFMRDVADEAADEDSWPQSSHIRRACGKPCSADYFLHTENLGAEWLNLLRDLELPLVALPYINGSPPRPGHTVFTREVVDIIHRIDADMFSEFGYRKRADVPFELTSSKHIDPVWV